MRSLRKSFILFILPLMVSSCLSSRKAMEMGIVESVDLERYAGKWYEIARYPHRFERDLVGVTAEYTITGNGRLKVVNSGYKGSFEGEFRSVEGKAKTADNSGSGWLKVSFFWFFYADYLILELDTLNYQYALIGSSSKNYLWILGREPFMDPETLQMLLNKAEERGYELTKIELVKQR
jgi:apolipoprotein D and lipocalin family protein